MRGYDYNTTDGALEADRREAAREASVTLHDRFQPYTPSPEPVERDMDTIDAINALEWLVRATGRPRWSAFAVVGRTEGEFDEARDAYDTSVRLLRSLGREV